jgi:hypothetical protein
MIRTNWIALALLLPMLVVAQPDTLWTTVHGIGNFNQARDLEFDPQGNIYLTGTWNWTEQEDPFDPIVDGDFWLVKLSPDGDVLIDRQYGTESGDQGHALVPAHDGGYVLIGSTYFEGTDASADAYIVHVDDDGEVVWETWIGSDVEDKAKDIVQTQDGGYIVVGWTRSGIEGMDDAYVFKIDVDGNLLWEQSFGGTQNDQLWSVFALENGNFISAGRTWSFGAGDRDAIIVELDPDGNVVWLNTIGGPWKDHIYEIAPAHDGGFIGTGKTESFDMDNGDAWLIKMDPLGNEEWISIWGNIRGEFGRSCTATTDGNYIFCGETGHWGQPGNQVLLAKADALGNWMWSHEVGGHTMDDAWSVRQAPNGDYVAAGFTKSFGEAEQSLYVVRYAVEYDPIDLDVYSSEEPVYVQQGDVFSRTWEIRNNQTVATDTLDLWQQIVGPDSAHTTHILFEDMIVLQSQTSMSATNELEVGDWSNGEFWLHMSVGNYPTAFSSDSLRFVIGTSDAYDPRWRSPYHPSEFSLGTAFPNPFNSATTVTLGLPNPAAVKLTLTDITGREIATVFSASMGAGVHRIPVRLDQIPSGMYFLTASADHGWVDTQKITLLK